MASGIRNPNATYTYDQFGEGDDGSFWTFRRDQTSDDRDAVQNMTTKTIVGSIDRKKVRELLKSGGDVEAYVSEITKIESIMTTEKAMLARMGVACGGPFFTIPEDYTDDNGAPHPMAGQVIPQPPSRKLLFQDPKQYEADLNAHIQWLGLLDPEERSSALTFMTAVWAGRNPDDIKRFQGSSVGVDEPVSG